MRYRIIFIFLMIIKANLYPSIKNIPLYPSGIKVSFTTSNEIISIEKSNGDDTKKRRKKSKKVAEPVVTKSIQQTNVSRIIRVINSINNLKSDENLALLFFDTDNNHIAKYIVSNTVKPTPEFIFFMDRKTGRDFQGKHDIYLIPEKAVSFSVKVINSKAHIIYETSHSAYNKNKQILIDDFKKIGHNKIMLQFEVLGSAENNLTRIAAFQF
ncbi:MAG: hypothetical protein ACRCTJ_06865 [Brevinema sp.]